MSWGFTALAGGALASGVMGSRAQRKAAEAQEEGGRLQVEEQRRQFDRMQEVLAPYVEGGEEALEAQRALIGLAGPEAEAAAVERLQQSPAFLAGIEQGEEAILQNAAATGGLRGGNVQGALAQFRPQMLADTIQRQFANLSGLTQSGQSSAAGVGAGALRTGENISSIYGNVADNAAASRLAQGKTVSDTLGTLGGLALAKTNPNIF